jgi:hypothetical protein
MFDRGQPKDRSSGLNNQLEEISKMLGSYMNKIRADR